MTHPISFTSAAVQRRPLVEPSREDSFARHALNERPADLGAIAGNPVPRHLSIGLAAGLLLSPALLPGSLHAQALTNTTTSLTLSPNPALIQQGVVANVVVQAVNERATSAAAPSGSLPGGTVAVTGGGQSCAATLNSGVGSCILSFPVSGNYTITANYPGDASYSASSGIADLTVDGSPAASTASVPTLSSGLLALLGAMLAALAFFAPRRKSR